MIKKIKEIFKITDYFFYKKFGSAKSTKLLENIKEAQIIFSYLNEVGCETKTRFVGGCVRKAISGETIDDIDLATILEPNQVKMKLEKEKIKVIETGISHGTLTALLKEKKFEITTLRRDISTDGRHAKVQFTSDWNEDAARRDFTINAIYADIQGRVLDPLNGMSDLVNGKIKFVGLPEERIQEDYLRILRYFRFFIQYSKTDHDQEVIKIIRKYINGINIISKERIFDELEKILKLKNIDRLFSDNISKEVIINIFPQFKYDGRLKKITNLKKKLREKYDSNLILSLLIVDETNNYEYFCHKYKVSNLIKNRLKNISKNFENLKSKKFFSEENIKKLIYSSNKKNVIDLLLFSFCVSKKINISNIEQLINYIDACQIPKFPISGDYLKEQGYEQGQILGEKLKLLQSKWIQNNFTIEKKEIEKTLGKRK